MTNVIRRWRNKWHVILESAVNHYQIHQWPKFGICEFIRIKKVSHVNFKIWCQMTSDITFDLPPQFIYVPCLALLQFGFNDFMSPLFAFLFFPMILMIWSCQTAMTCIKDVKHHPPIISPCQLEMTVPRVIQSLPWTWGVILVIIDSRSSHNGC